MIITFSGIKDIPRGADVYLCLADQELHPCFTKRNDPKWSNKSFHVLQFNDTGYDDRYRQVTMEDIEYCIGLFKSLTDEHIHVNCHAGISRSAAITILGLMTTYEAPTLENYRSIHAAVSSGRFRVPANETFPNGTICKMIVKQYKLLNNEH